MEMPKVKVQLEVLRIKMHQRIRCIEKFLKNASGIII